jgi:hypothetical protein
VDVVEVLRRLGGVQAQVPAAAALAVRARQRRSSRDDLGRALEERRLIRTWAMRGTLHLLPPEEAGAYLSLIAASRFWEKGSWQKAFGVTPDEMVVAGLKPGRTHKSEVTVADPTGVGIQDTGRLSRRRARTRGAPRSVHRDRLGTAAHVAASVSGRVDAVRAPVRAVAPRPVERAVRVNVAARRALAYAKPIEPMSGEK